MSIRMFSIGFCLLLWIACCHADLIQGDLKICRDVACQQPATDFALGDPIYLHAAITMKQARIVGSRLNAVLLTSPQSKHPISLTLPSSAEQQDYENKDQRSKSQMMGLRVLDPKSFGLLSKQDEEGQDRTLLVAQFIPWMADDHRSADRVDVELQSQADNGNERHPAATHKTRKPHAKLPRQPRSSSASSPSSSQRRRRNEQQSITGSLNSLVEKYAYTDSLPLILEMLLEVSYIPDSASQAIQTASAYSKSNKGVQVQNVRLTLGEEEDDVDSQEPLDQTDDNHAPVKTASPMSKSQLIKKTTHSSSSSSSPTSSRNKHIDEHADNDLVDVDTMTAPYTLSQYLNILYTRTRSMDPFGLLSFTSASQHASAGQSPLMNVLCMATALGVLSFILGFSAFCMLTVYHRCRRHDSLVNNHKHIFHFNIPSPLPVKSASVPNLASKDPSSSASHNHHQSQPIPNSAHTHAVLKPRFLRSARNSQDFTHDPSQLSESSSSMASSSLAPSFSMPSFSRDWIHMSSWRLWLRSQWLHMKPSTRMEQDTPMASSSSSSSSLQDKQTLLSPVTQHLLHEDDRHLAESASPLE